MTATPKTLDVSIMGREYRVACPPNQEKELLEAVVYLDRKMREIREHGKVVGVERIAVMAALNIAHELLMTRAGGAFDIPGFKRRIETMQAAIDGALAEEDQRS